MNQEAEPMNSSKSELSTRQKDVLDVIFLSLDRYGIPPTYREIGNALGISSTNGVSDHIKALVKKGYLISTRGKGASRGWKLTPKARSVRRGDVVEVPLLKERATWPFELDDYDGVIRLDRTLLPKGELVARGWEGRVAITHSKEMEEQVGEVILLPTKDGKFIQLGPVVLVVEVR